MAKPKRPTVKKPTVKKPTVKKPASTRPAIGTLPSSIVRELATSKPAWLRPVPAVKPRKDEPPIVGETLPALFRVGFPHIRFVDDADVDDPRQATEDIFLGWWTGDWFVRPRSVWSRFVRAYAGSVTVLSSDPRKRALTKEAKQALEDDAPIAPGDVPALVRQLMAVPASLRQRGLTEDFFYALEAMCGPACVSDAIVSVLEKPPSGRMMPQIGAVADAAGLALGFVRLRLSGAEQEALDRRLSKLLDSGSKSYPIPTARISSFLETARPPKGALKVGGAHLPIDLLHTTDKPAIIAGISALRLDSDPLFLLDPRLVFLAGVDAIPAYLARFADYERYLHANTARIQLGAFVDAIAPFRDPRVAAWLAKLQTHPLVGADAKAWLAILQPN